MRSVKNLVRPGCRLLRTSPTAMTYNLIGFIHHEIKIFLHLLLFRGIVMVR